MTKYTLFIDETGMGDPKTYQKSPFFVLVGCIIKDENKHEIQSLADHIKYKYWGRTDIIFHSIKIGQKKEDFYILLDEKVNASFLKDLRRLLSSPQIKFIYSLIDKSKAFHNGWTSKTIYKRASKAIIETFLAILSAKKAKGQIVCEYSTSEKDVKLYEAFAHYLSRGIPSLKISHFQAKMRLTSIQFATKLNNDTETQLCDLLGHIVKYKHLKGEGLLKEKHEYNYEEYMLSALVNSLFTIPIRTNEQKSTIYKKIKPATIMP